MKWIFIFFYSLFCIEIIRTVKLTEFKGTLTYENPKFVLFSKFFIGRKRRRGPYVLDMIYETYYDYGNNVTVTILGLEYLSNEYRRSFVDFSFPFCSSNVVFKGIGSFLPSCPLLAGHNIVDNYDCAKGFENVPESFPFSKGRFNFSILITKTKEVFVEGFVDFVLKKKLGS